MKMFPSYCPSSTPAQEVRPEWQGQVFTSIKRLSDNERKMLYRAKKRLVENEESDQVEASTDLAANAMNITGNVIFGSVFLAGLIGLVYFCGGLLEVAPK